MHKKFSILIVIICLTAILLSACNSTPSATKPSSPEQTPESTPSATEPCTEHLFGEWNITTAPTCNEEGVQTHTCDVCGFKEEQTIDATGHIFIETTDRATCSFAGTLTKTCSCGLVETEELPAGHAFTEWSSDIVVANLFINHQRRDCKFCKVYETKYDSIITDVTTKLFTKLDNSKYNATINRTQGGVYNGSDYYQAYIKNDDSPAVVAKKNLETGEIIYSEPRVMGHANDMTYNSTLHQVVVCNNQKIVFFYDADTLEYVREVNLTTRLAAISYNPHNNTYTGYGNSKIYTLDENLNFIGTFVMKKTLATSQGICSDETYVYNIYTPVINGKYTCHIIIHDHNGNYITTIDVDMIGQYEAENLSLIDGQLYIMGVTPKPFATLFTIIPKT